MLLSFITCLYVNDKVSEVLERQTIVDQVDKPWCHVSPQQLGEAVGHQPSPAHLAQRTETQSHRWVQMSTYGAQQEMEGEENRKEEDKSELQQERLEDNEISDYL